MIESGIDWDPMSSGETVQYEQKCKLENIYEGNPAKMMNNREHGI